MKNPNLTRKKAPNALSPQQSKVLFLRKRGHSYKEIAAELGITVCTVKFHIQKVFAKTGTHSSAAAIFVCDEERHIPQDVPIRHTGQKDG